MKVLYGKVRNFSLTKFFFIGMGIDHPTELRPELPPKFQKWDDGFSCACASRTRCHGNLKYSAQLAIELARLQCLSGAKNVAQVATFEPTERRTPKLGKANMEEFPGGASD